jgi:hypothetical protein
MNDNARILPREAIEDGAAEAGGDSGRSCDPYFSCRRVGQEFDVSDSLPQLIEGDDTAIEKRSPIDRRLNTMRAAIKQPHTKRVL